MCSSDLPRGLFESPFPTFTGAQDEMSIPASKVDSIDSKIRLRSETPVKNEWFDLDYDYGAFKFLVSLKEPKKDSKIKFLEWLKNGGFDKIPQDEFIFIK